MANPMSPRPEQQLLGELNYLAWCRDFEDAVQALDLMDIFQGTAERFNRELDLQDYDVVKDGNDIAEDLFRYELALRRAEVYHTRLARARSLLALWISPLIQFQFDLAQDPDITIRAIITAFQMSPTHIRQRVLYEASELRLSDCTSMAEYVKKHRRFSVELQNAGFEHSGAWTVTMLLVGLPPSYQDFKKRFHRECMGSPERANDIDFLARLLSWEEEVKLTSRSTLSTTKGNEGNNDDRNNNDTRDAKDKTGRNNKNVRDTKDKKRKTDKSRLTCTTCNKRGHEEDNCWKIHPEQIPNALRDKDWIKKGYLLDDDKTNGERTAAMAMLDAGTDQPNDDAEAPIRTMAAIAEVNLASFVAHLRKARKAPLAHE